MNRLLSLLAATTLAACTNSTAQSSLTTTGQEGLSPSTVVATYAGKTITLADLDASLGNELYKLRRDGLENMILRDLVETKAKSEGKEPNAMLREIAMKRAAPADEAALRASYEEHKSALGGRSFDEVRPMLEARLSQQAQQKAVVAYLDELKKEAKVRISLPEPRIQVAATGPSRGPKDAPVTVVAFSDFQCPYCSRAVTTVDRIMKDYAGKVRLVFRNFPLPFHKDAGKAAEAALCADEQGKFWELHDHMFRHQDALSIASLTEVADKLGIDGAKLRACVESGKYRSQVQADIDAGRKAGVSGTPAFFVNGRMLSGAQPYERFKQVIDEELQGG